MLIECLIKRDGPTHVVVAGFDYVFKPNERGRSVCEVMSSGHQAHFLALKDYVEYKAPKSASPVASVKKDKPEIEGGAVETEEKAETFQEEVKEPSTTKVYLKKNGQPYATETAALSSARHHGLKKYKAVEVDGGFGLVEG